MERMTIRKIVGFRSWTVWEYERSLASENGRMGIRNIVGFGRWNVYGKTKGGVFLKAFNRKLSQSL